jgi:hypothetical protein
LYGTVVHHAFGCVPGSGCSDPEEFLAHATF